MRNVKPQTRSDYEREHDDDNEVVSVHTYSVPKRNSEGNVPKIALSTALFDSFIMICYKHAFAHGMRMFKTNNRGKKLEHIVEAVLQKTREHWEMPDHQSEIPTTPNETESSRGHQ